MIGKHQMKSKLLAFNTDMMAYTAHNINVAGCRAQSGRATPSQTPAGPSQGTEGISGASGTADVPVFGSMAGHASYGRTENPKTPPGGPPANTSENTAYDESHAHPSDYSAFAGGASAWSNHQSGHYTSVDRTDPSRTYRINPVVYDQIRTRRRSEYEAHDVAQTPAGPRSTPYDQHDHSRAYRTSEGQDYYSA